MRLNYLDVLKAFAIIAVVLYHSGFMPYGYLGVDLFLVINGYLITKGLTKRFLFQPSGGDNLLVNGVGSRARARDYFNFEISRVVRLLPILLLAGVVCMVAGYFVMLPDDYENLSQSVVATDVFGNNILAAITTKNYWDVVNEYKPLMHTWYVGVVMQFYIVYPLLFFIAKLDKKNPQRTLISMISVLAITSLLIYFGTSNVAARFYYLPARFFEFAAGGIVALTWKPIKDQKPFSGWIVWPCYALILALMGVNMDVLPSSIKLVLVVVLSVVLIMSSTILENRITGNVVLARIGAASYSLFVWHQVLLAFYRYTYSSVFTVGGYLIFVLAVTLLSWLTYLFIEQRTSHWLKEKRSKTLFYMVMVIVWVGLTTFSGYIYKKGGVVRDVPELYISKDEQVNHKAYNDKIYSLNKPFTTDKRHWLVVGNSFGRDFANVILESSIADSVELSYIYMDDYQMPEYAERYATADLIWLSNLGTDEDLVKSMDELLRKNGRSEKQLVVVGTKNFGTSNGQFYIKRGLSTYYNQRTPMEGAKIISTEKGTCYDGGYYKETNERLKRYCGERYLDLISLVIDDKGTMPVFTPDHHYVSQDCRHFSMGGAKWYATMIDWSKYLN